MDIQEELPIRLCAICDSVQVDPRVSTRCDTCNTLCEQHVQRRRGRFDVSPAAGDNMCEMCGTEVDYNGCMSNVTIGDTLFNCNCPFRLPFVRQFNCYCNLDTTEETINFHRACFPACERERDWINRQSPDFQRRYYLGSPFAQNFKKLLAVTNLENADERVDLIIWIARFASDYNVARDWIETNVSYDDMELYVAPIYPSVEDTWKIDIYKVMECVLK